MSFTTNHRKELIVKQATDSIITDIFLTFFPNCRRQERIQDILKRVARWGPLTVKQATKTKACMFVLPINVMLCLHLSQ